MENNKLKRSNKEHLRLNRKYNAFPNTWKNRLYGNYHADCLNTQKIKGRVLSRKEKREIFNFWYNVEKN